MSRRGDDVDLLDARGLAPQPRFLATIALALRQWEREVGEDEVAPYGVTKQDMRTAAKVLDVAADMAQLAYPGFVPKRKPKQAQPRAEKESRDLVTQIVAGDL